MNQVGSAQQTNALKLPTFFLSFQTEERVLRVNKSEITDKNAFNRDLFETEDNHESSKDEKTWFDVFFEICYALFNPQIAKYGYLRFSSINWF